MLGYNSALSERYMGNEPDSEKKGKGTGSENADAKAEEALHR